MYQPFPSPQSENMVGRYGVFEYLNGSGGNPDVLENIQLLKDGVKFSDVFTNGDDILDSEDLRIEFEHSKMPWN